MQRTQGSYRTPRKTSKKPVTEPARHCDKPAKPLPRYWGIPFADGAEAWHSTAYLAEHCCPHCLADYLVEAGLLRYGSHGQLESPLRFDVQATADTDGYRLLQLLLRKSIPFERLINIDTSPFVGCC